MRVEIGFANSSVGVVSQVIKFITNVPILPVAYDINYNHQHLIIVEFYKYIGHVSFSDNPKLVYFVRSTVNKHGGSRYPFTLYEVLALTIPKNKVELGTDFLFISSH